MTVGFDAVPLRSGHMIRGIGRYLTGILTALLREQPEWAREHLRLLVAGGQSSDGIPFWRTRRSSFRRQDLDWLASVLLDRLAVRAAPPFAWHMTDPWTPFSTVSAARTIATVYDLIPLKDPAAMARIRPHRRLIYRRYLRSVKEARLVVAISQTTADDVAIDLEIPRDRIHVVYPSLMPALDDRQMPEQSANRLDLLFVGVPEPHKRPGLVLQVLAELTRRGMDAFVTFVGPQPAKDRAALEGLASDLSISARVRFLGPVGSTALIRLYRTSITLAVSRVEGFGLPPVEAIIAGGRVVATPSRIYHEVLASTATFAANDDPGAVADAVLLVQAGDRRGSSARDLAERFSPSNAAASLITAYEAVLHS